MPPPKKPKTGPTRAEAFLSESELEQLIKKQRETEQPLAELPSPTEIPAKLPSSAEIPAVCPLPAISPPELPSSFPSPAIIPQPGPSNEPAKFVPAASSCPRRSFVSETALDRKRFHTPIEEGTNDCCSNKGNPPPLILSPWKMSENPRKPNVIPPDLLAEQNKHIETLLRRERERFAVFSRKYQRNKSQQAQTFFQEPLSHSALELSSHLQQSPTKDHQRWIGHLLQSDSKTDRSVKGLLTSPDHLHDHLPPPVAPSLQTCRDPQCSYSLHSSATLHSVTQCSPHNLAFKRMAQQFASTPARSHQSVLNFLRPYAPNGPKLGTLPRFSPIPAAAAPSLVKRFLLAEQDEEVQYLREHVAAKVSLVPLASPTHSDIEIVMSPSSPPELPSQSAMEEDNEKGLPGAQVAASISSEDSIALEGVPSQTELLTLLNSAAPGAMMEQATSSTSNMNPGISSSVSSSSFAPTPEVSPSTSSYLNLGSNILQASTFTTLQSKDVSGPSDQSGDRLTIDSSEKAAQNFSPVAVFHASQQEMPSSTVEERRRSRNNQGVHDMKMSGQSCQICEDAASGFHYGVWSCEGCKAFFKRSLQGPVDYVCPATQNCTIDRQRRKSCQACRLNKCIQMGMSRGNCRRERERPPGKAARKKKGDDMQSSPPKVRIKEEREGQQSPVAGSSSSSSSVAAATEPPPATSAAPVTEPIPVHALVAHLMRVDPPVRHSNHDPSLPDSWENLMGSLFKLADFELMDVITWAKNIPGYSALSLKLRIHLLEACWMEVLLIGLLWRSQNHKGYLVFAPDLEFDVRRIKAANLESTIAPVMKLSVLFNRLHVTREEMVLLRVLALINSDICDDNDEELALKDELQQSVHEAFEYTVIRRQRQAPSRLLSLLSLLPHIRTAAMLSLQRISEIKSSSRLPLEDLLAEMLEGSSKASHTMANQAPPTQ